MFAQGFACAKQQIGARAVLFALRLRCDLVGVQERPAVPVLLLAAFCMALLASLCIPTPTSHHVPLPTSPLPSSFAEACGGQPPVRRAKRALGHPGASKVDVLELLGWSRGAAGSRWLCREERVGLGVWGLGSGSSPPQGS